MATPNPLIRFRYEDYQTLPESMSARYELLDGALLMVPAPTVTHQRISRNLEFILFDFVRTHDLGEVFDAPIDVVFGGGDEREIAQPDIVFVEKSQNHIITPKEIQGAPALIIEILSQVTQQRDRGYKKILYGRYGVREYWIVDAEKQTVEIYTLTVQGLTLTRRYSSADVLTSAMLSGFRLALAEVFPE